MHAPLIMVLGHQGCGAVRAAISAVDNHEQFPGPQSIASALAPAVRAAKDMQGDRFDNVVNERRSHWERLRKQPPVLSRLVGDQKLLVAGGFTDCQPAGLTGLPEWYLRFGQVTRDQRT